MTRSIRRRWLATVVVLLVAPLGGCERGRASRESAEFEAHPSLEHPAAAASSAERPASAGTAPASGGSGVAFAALGFDAGLARARDEKKLLMVDVYTDWCGWCRKLDREVFSDARVASALGGVVPIRLNAERGGEDVARRFGIQGLPTVLFLDPSGALVKRIDGYVNLDEMISVASSLPKPSA